MRKRCTASGWKRGASSRSCFMGRHSCNGCFAVNMHSNSKIIMEGFYEARCCSGRNAGHKQYLLCSHCYRGVPGVAGPCSKICWHYALPLAIRVYTPKRLSPLWLATPPINYVTTEDPTAWVNTVDTNMMERCCWINGGPNGSPVNQFRFSGY